MMAMYVCSLSIKSQRNIVIAHEQKKKLLTYFYIDEYLADRVHVGMYIKRSIRICFFLISN
jgi:hypothetical protein